ncbi:MAG: SGNH/GDSL hydrolase family protein [Elusimicrobia bacterium]|nr:SGNH/GDSL hydrolase family protein [Elusimicrobiota bacterium]
MSRLRSLLVDLSLSAASLLLFYLFCELVVFPLNLIHFPHRLQWRANDPLLLFTQSTRRHRLPKDYIAIVGDSHAAGVISDEAGLAKFSSLGRASDAYLFRKTGRDILALGQPGAGSLGGLVGTPIGTLEFFARTRLYRVPEPSVILAYFYEGNDLDDSIRELEQRYDGKSDAARFKDPAYFREFIEGVVLAEHPLHRVARDFRWYDNLLLARLIRNYAARSWANTSFKRPDLSRFFTRNSKPVLMNGLRPAPAPSPPPVNRVLVDGKEVGLPPALQSPALELTVPELERAAWVFEQSLKHLAGRFPKARVYTVYIPSPLSCYELASPKVSIERYHSRGELYDSRLVRPRSELIAGLIRKASERCRVPFIDARPAMRAEAEKRLIHGPRDWFHPNAIGYAVLGDAVLGGLERSR